MDRSLTLSNAIHHVLGIITDIILRLFSLLKAVLCSSIKMTRWGWFTLL